MIISDLDPDLVESALFFALESGPGFFTKLIPDTGKKSTTVSPFVKVLSKKVDYAMKYLMFKH